MLWVYFLTDRRQHTPSIWYGGVERVGWGWGRGGGSMWVQGKGMEPGGGGTQVLNDYPLPNSRVERRQ